MLVYGDTSEKNNVMLKKKIPNICMVNIFNVVL